MGAREPSTPSRREALKLAGAAALGGVSVSLAGAAASARADAATILPGRISVTIGGVPVKGLESVVPFLSASASVEQPLPGSKETISEPGDLITHGAVITRLWTASSDWLEWRMSVVNGTVDRRNVIVKVFDTTGRVASSHVYGNCWVQEYTYPALHAHSHDPLTESITIRPERHTIQ